MPSKSLGLFPASLSRPSILSRVRRDHKQNRNLSSCSGWCRSATPARWIWNRLKRWLFWYGGRRYCAYYRFKIWAANECPFSYWFVRYTCSRYVSCFTGENILFVYSLSNVPVWASAIFPDHFIPANHNWTIDKQYPIKSNEQKRKNSSDICLSFSRYTWNILKVNFDELRV